jgi:protocatechuate 3,4-dioxygenase alpha subunit
MLQQTPSQTVGPFFYDGMFRGGENILATDQTRGQPIVITGQVLDGDGEPVPDAVIEIWQADAEGIFNHPADPRRAAADPNFRGFGRAATREGGTYEFHTVKPGRVPDRAGALQAPHIDMRVFARGMLIHADTRLYFEDEPANADDVLLTSVDPARRHTLLAARLDGPDRPEYRFDIRLQGDDETVFFES